MSRFAVQRYRVRLLILRLVHARPRPIELLDRVLAVIGAWSVIFALLRSVTPDRFRLEGAVAAAMAAVLGLWLFWVRLARRPQDVFRAASATESRAEQLRQSMILGMRNSAAFDCLVRLYEPVVDDVRRSCSGTTVDWPVDADGKRCLVLTLASDPTQRLADLLVGVGRPRDHAWHQKVSSFAPERQAFISVLRRSVATGNTFGDEEGMNVILDEITCEDALHMTVTSGSYGQIVRTSDSLINEFALFGYLAGRSAFRRRDKPLRLRAQDVLRLLPWRREVHSWDTGTDVLLRPQGRAAGVGVSMVLVDRRAAGTYAYIARRSSGVGTYPDVLHVVPSGMVNARGDLHRQASESLRSIAELTMMSEFVEECFDVEELSGHSVVNFAARVHRELHTRGLDSLRPTLTGLAIDLLNLRTEICAVLDLTDYRAAVDEFTLSWEYTHNDPMRTTDLARGSLDLDRTDFVQSGVGCIHLGSSWLAARGEPSGEGDQE